MNQNGIGRFPDYTSPLGGMQSLALETTTNSGCSTYLPAWRAETTVVRLNCLYVQQITAVLTILQGCTPLLPNPNTIPTFVHRLHWAVLFISHNSSS